MSDEIQIKTPGQLLAHTFLKGLGAPEREAALAQQIDGLWAAAEQRGAAAERERIEKSIVSYSLTQAAYAHDIQVCDDLLAAIRAGQEG